MTPTAPQADRSIPLDAIRVNLAAAEAAAGPQEALPHLRAAADRLTDLIDESMAHAVLSGDASLRSAGAGAGLSENAVGPRLGRTAALRAYANGDGRVTASGVERARYDRETGVVPPAPAAAAAVPPPMRFKPRRPS